MAAPHEIPHSPQAPPASPPQKPSHETPHSPPPQQTRHQHPDDQKSVNQSAISPLLPPPSQRSRPDQATQRPRQSPRAKYHRVAAASKIAQASPQTSCQLSR